MSLMPNGVIELLNRAGELHWNFAVVMFVQVSILIVVLLVLDFLILRRLRASIRYALWMLVLVKMMLPVTLQSPVSISRWLPEFQTEVQLIETPAAQRVGDIVPMSATTVVPAAHDPALQGSSFPDRTNQQTIMEGNIPDAPVGEVASASSSVISKSPQLQQTATTAGPSSSLDWKAVVLISWAIMVLFLLVVLARRTLFVRRIIANSGTVPQDLESLFQECMNLTRDSGNRVRLRISDDLGSPAICGIWRGTILLPRSLLTRLNGQQLKEILVHELVHWRRFDLQVNCLQTLLLIAYFYNPLVWLANVILKRSREQAVDEEVLKRLGSLAADYSNTLLEIASLSRSPAEAMLRLVGVVESRKALTGRIKRILSRPLPRTTRLGFTGIAIVVIAGVALLPMGGTSASTAIAQNTSSIIVDAGADPEQKETSQIEQAGEDSSDNKNLDQKPSGENQIDQDPEQLVLIGRLQDEAGKPVTDAEIKLSHIQSGKAVSAKTDEQGFYRIDQFKHAGRYRLTIASQRWVGIGYRDREEITLAIGAPVTRNFTLKRACTLRIKTINEQGKPVRGVRVLANNLAAEDFIAPESVMTDAEGFATVGGLAPSKTEYLFATWHDDYVFERLVLKLDDPTQTPEQDILLVLRRGKTIKGTAICSDGKPPAGWRIRALPSWWHFGRYPTGTTIAEDGSFTLSHIAAGKYDVTISVLHGDSGSSPRQVLKQAELVETDGVLKVKMDHPSPASLVSITGKVKRTGKAIDQGFWIFADSKEPRYHRGYYLHGGKTEFKIGPIPKGDYELKVENVGLSSKPLTVTAPAEDVELVVRGIGQPKLTGRVIDVRTKAPITHYRLRVFKLRTLSGPHFVQRPEWREFKNDTGVFEYEVHGPGVYKVQVAADGFAWNFSDEINTDKDSGKPVLVALSSGVSLSGTVVDEGGNPIDGAMVVPLSKAANPLEAMSDRSIDYEGVIETTNGEFEISRCNRSRSGEE